MNLNFQDCSLSLAPSWTLETLEETLEVYSCGLFFFFFNGKGYILQHSSRSPVLYKQSYGARMVVRILGIQERER